ncbi:YgaP-like transmembrane domain [Cupriavidus basilensis]|uniref:YgaP-like transmembrane domain n=1 Tax=Cupriavidus basilensis TaxID=68895 RepID=UPI0005BC51C6
MQSSTIVVGLALIGLAVTGTIGGWGWIGVIPVLTGLIRNCPLYSLPGLGRKPRLIRPACRPRPLAAGVRGRKRSQR